MPFPDFDPVLLQLGPIAIRWYALAYVAGILLGWRWGVHLVKRTALWRGSQPTASERQIDDLVLWITLGIIVGGRLGYVLFYRPDLILNDPMEIFRTWNGGMSFHGGFLGCVAAVVLFGWKRNIPILTVGDVTCAAAPIGLFFGRLANFINGELWGRPADVPWAMVFPHAGNLPRHPSQIYEAALEGLLLFVVLFLLIRSGALKRPGLILGSFALVYSLARSFSEFFREPDAQLGFLWGGATMGMLLSIPLALAGMILIAYALRRKPRQA